MFGNKGKAVHEDSISFVKYSLIFIRANNPEIHIRNDYGKQQIRLKFIHNSIEYDLPITDVTFEEKHRVENNLLLDASHVYLTISLGVLYEGWHHKLVAGITYLNELVDDLPF